jgi:hypothetical protein
MTEKPHHWPRDLALLRHGLKRFRIPSSRAIPRAQASEAGTTEIELQDKTVPNEEQNCKLEPKKIKHELEKVESRVCLSKTLLSL